MVEWSVPGYTGLRTLGSGGFGEVVLARHDRSETPVAIKYLRQNLLSDPEFAEMFRNEATVLAALDDPHVVRLYEYVESPYGAAIVMELIDGVSLRKILTGQGKTTPEAALVVLRGSLLGLAAAHQHGVVHRDYKPENVLVNGDGDSKLTDFGIAARAGESPIAAGTLVYAPPEQFGGSPASPAGDVYAATATFYECLAGRPPFTGDTAERLLYQHLAEPVPLEPVPEPLRPLVAAGMAKDPRDRPADASTFVTQLTAIAAGNYGPDWEQRGRSHLGEAALLLAALWPSGAAPVLQGSTVEQIHLSQGGQGGQGAQDAGESPHLRHLWHLKHLRHLRHELHLRHLRAMAGAAAVLAVVAGGTALAAAAMDKSAPPGKPAAAVHLITLQPPSSSAAPAGSASSSPSSSSSSASSKPSPKTRAGVRVHVPAAAALDAAVRVGVAHAEAVEIGEAVGFRVAQGVPVSLALAVSVALPLALALADADPIVATAVIATAVIAVTVADVFVADDLLGSGGLVRGHLAGCPQDGGRRGDRGHGQPCSDDAARPGQIRALQLYDIGQPPDHRRRAAPAAGRPHPPTADRVAGPPACPLAAHRQPAPADQQAQRTRPGAGQRPVDPGPAGTACHLGPAAHRPATRGSHRLRRRPAARGRDVRHRHLDRHPLRRQRPATPRARSRGSLLGFAPNDELGELSQPDT